MVDVCSSVVSLRMLQIMTQILSGKLSLVIECSSCKLPKVKNDPVCGDCYLHKDLARPDSIT
jgi:hypothetical protein